MRIPVRLAAIGSTASMVAFTMIVTRLAICRLVGMASR